MPFLPRLRSTQTKALTSAEAKASVPVAFASYYAALSTYNLHHRAGNWPVERAVVEGFERAIWVFKSVQSIASDSSRLPYRLREGGEVVDDHPMYRVLNKQANPLESGPVFRKRLSAQILLSKRGAFVEVTKSNGGTVKRLDLLPPDRTEIVPGTGADLVDHIRLTRRDGSVKNIDADKVLWFRDPHPLDPYSGVTPLESAGMSIELDYFARLYNVSFMQNDGRPGGVLAVRKTDGTGGDIDPKQMDRLEEKFGKGPQEAGKLSVIAGQLDYVDLATRPRDMQYGQTSRNAKIEVLSAFGVGESVLGYAADRTFDNADNELYVYWTRTVFNHNDILLDGFDANSEDALEGFFDTSDVEVLERADRQRRDEARTEVAAGLRSIYSYAELAGIADEIEETPYTRALYVAQGKTPLPARAYDSDALGLATPAPGGAPGGAPGAETPPGAEPGAEAPVGPPAQAGAAPGGPGGAEDSPAAALPAANGTAPAPSGAARAALDALATSGKSAGDDPAPKVRLAYRLGASVKAASPTGSYDAESDPDLAAADALEAAIAEALRGYAERWIERAAVRVESPKQRKGTRHWAPQYDHDTRVGVKALDAAKAVDEQTWQAEAEQATHPLIEAAAIAAAVALLTDLGVAPPPGLALPTWAATMVAQTVAETVAWIGRSAAFQASALIRSINIADQQGDSIGDIARTVREKGARMRAWADGLATQAATTTSNAARDDAAREAPNMEIDRVWFSRRDDRVRFTHAPRTGADGQVRALDEPFVVGTALLMQPGDVRAPLRETAGCRCYLRYRARRSGRWASPPAEVDGKAIAPTHEPRDADSDGLIYEGTPLERPATPRVPVPPAAPHAVPGPPRSPIPVPTTAGATSALALGLPGRPDGRGTLDDPIDVRGDHDLAARLLAEGKHVRLNRVDEVGTLLDKLTDLVRRAEDAGEDAPMFDLCLVSVPKTNLFCAETKGIPRAQMPQLSGWPLPGSIAETTLPKNRRGGVNGIPAFLEELDHRDVKVTETDVRASWLKASQSQLNGAQVAKIAAGMRAGTYPDAPIFVTRDGYVIDGHHRWAAKVAIDTEDNRLGEVTMPVRVIDMEIGEALDFANEFSRRIGIQPEALGEGDSARRDGRTDLPAPVVRNPLFGQRIGDPVKRAVGSRGDFHVIERIGGPKPGDVVERLLYRVERRDGIWGVYPPAEQAPALYLTGSKRTAERWAADRAKGIPDPDA